MKFTGQGNLSSARTPVRYLVQTQLHTLSLVYSYEGVRWLGWMPKRPEGLQCPSHIFRFEIGRTIPTLRVAFTLVHSKFYTKA
jgi:hypothetical protein